MALDFPKGRFPNRDKARALLGACHNNRENIEQWNEYRKNNGGWDPDFSDEGDQAQFHSLALCYEDDKGQKQGIVLSGAKLSGARLWGANLSGARLWGANLSGADLEDADLSGARLWNANLSGAGLKNANLGGAYLWGANLTGAELENANLTGANLEEANLSGAYLRGANFGDANVTGVTYDRRDLNGKCQGIRVATCFGDAIFKRDAEDQDYIDTLGERISKRRRPLAKVARKNPRFAFNPREFWRNPRKSFESWRHRQHAFWAHQLFHAWGWIDYGRGLLRTAGIAFAIAMVFGFIFLIADKSGNALLEYKPPSAAGSGTPNWWFTPFYYSIVTYTTLGFGDVTPCTGMGQFIVVIEVIFGYLTLGLLVSVLANKVARRS